MTFVSQGGPPPQRGGAKERRPGPHIPRDRDRDRDRDGAAAGSRRAPLPPRVPPRPLVAAATGTSPAPSGFAWRRLFRCGE